MEVDIEDSWMQEWIDWLIVGRLMGKKLNDWLIFIQQLEIVEKYARQL